MYLFAVEAFLKLSDARTDERYSIVSAVVEDLETVETSKVTD